jgi:hypothetical protein
VAGVGEVGLDRSVAGERFVWADVVVELAEVLDHHGHLGAVGRQSAPEVLDLDRAVVALDDAVGLRALAAGADVREFGPRSDVAGEADGLVAGAVGR